MFLGSFKYNPDTYEEEFIPASKMSEQELEEIRANNPGIIIHLEEKADI